MITSDGWFSWMDRDPGPADKVYSEPCTSEIVIFHDAVGYYGGWMSRLKSTARDAQGRYTLYAAASVTGWLPYKAGLVPTQHYAIDKSCWASGSRFLNVHGNAFENESAPGYGTWDPHNPPPQSDWQVECAARIERELSEHFGRPAGYWRRPTSAADVTATEYEHNETVRWGGLYSSCSNGRIRWADIAVLRDGQEPAQEEEEEMKSFVADCGDGYRYVVRGDGTRILLGLRNDNNQVTPAGSVRAGAALVAAGMELRGMTGADLYEIPSFEEMLHKETS